jgi:toxin YoeB
VEVIYTEKAQEDIRWWKLSGNKKAQQKIGELVEEIKVSPFEGTGKPEPLKSSLSGLYSRRITKEDRIIYSIEDGRLVVYSLKGHYE